MCWRNVSMATMVQELPTLATKSKTSRGWATRLTEELSKEGQDMERRVLERLASGEPVKVSTLRTATAASLPLLAGLVRKKWIARETAAAERDARRMERFAVLVTEARLPALTEKQQAILAELAASGGELPLAELRRRDLPSSTLQTLVRRGLVRIEERAEAFRLGGLLPATAAVHPERGAKRSADDHRECAWAGFILFCSTE